MYNLEGILQLITLSLYFGILCTMFAFLLILTDPDNDIW